MNQPEHILSQAKSLGDAASLTTMIAAYVGWAPDVAALVSIVWVAIRIYETKTVQNILRPRDKK